MIMLMDLLACVIEGFLIGTGSQYGDAGAKRMMMIIIVYYCYSYLLLFLLTLITIIEHVFFVADSALTRNHCRR